MVVLEFKLHLSSISIFLKNRSWNWIIRWNVFLLQNIPEKHLVVKLSLA